MSYCGKGCYASPRLEGVVNKFYINIGNTTINNHNTVDNRQINNGIHHSIAAERTGDIHVYSQSIDNRVGFQQNNYVVNMDNRKVEFIPPYIGGQGSQRYLPVRDSYALPTSQDTLQLPQPGHEYSSMITTGLLNSSRPLTQFVDTAEDVQELVKETFQTLTGSALPNNIIMHVCDEKEMAEAHKKSGGGEWNPGILGFALNRHPLPSHIFIKQNHLDALMLTIGHELGHVLTTSLGNVIDEEAKAFAFELAWAKTIMENNIGNLANNFNVDFRPANNGIHDRAFNFVQKLVEKGKKALDLFWNISQGLTKLPAT